tara:strand:+ start:382 stop:1236 length:855 start_codon:yes stop_codon:yes gene_type:complete
MTTSKCAHLDNIKFLTIFGEDRKEFLQGIITNDIYKCEKKVIYSCLLSPQGKFLSDFFIIPKSDYFIIEIDELFIDDFISKLNIYKLRSKVKIEKEKNLKVINVLKNDLSETGKLVSKEEFIQYVDPRSKLLGERIIATKEIIDNYIKNNDLIVSNKDEYYKIMIKNLIPNSNKDLIVNKSLLLENNFDKINAIDWNKGCYVGQEITARMKYRALVKKTLWSIEADSTIINPNDEIFLNDKIIGYISSCIDNIGLAMLKNEEVKKVKKNNLTLSTKKGRIKILN